MKLKEFGIYLLAIALATLAMILMSWATTTLKTKGEAYRLSYGVLVPKYQSCIYQPDCRKLAEALYFEARGEGKKGMIAVGQVVMNRVGKRYFPDTISDVIQYRCHFTYLCNGSVDKGVGDWQSYKLALHISTGVMSYCYKDVVKGADHYFNPKELTSPPNWSRIYPKVIEIGNHRFHRRNHG